AASRCWTGPPTSRLQNPWCRIRSRRYLIWKSPPARPGSLRPQRPDYAGPDTSRMILMDRGFGRELLAHWDTERRQCARCSRRGLITQRDENCPDLGAGRRIRRRLRRRPLMLVPSADRQLRAAAGADDQLWVVRVYRRTGISADRLAMHPLDEVAGRERPHA